MNGVVHLSESTNLGDTIGDGSEAEPRTTNFMHLVGNGRLYLFPQKMTLAQALDLSLLSQRIIDPEEVRDHGILTRTGLLLCMGGYLIEDDLNIADGRYYRDSAAHAFWTSVRWMVGHGIQTFRVHDRVGNIIHPNLDLTHPHV